MTTTTTTAGGAAVTKRLMAALLLFVVFALPMRADFDEVAKAISQKRGVKRVWIPFLGVARFAVWVVSPSGVHDFQLATFEGGRDVDPLELREVLRTHAGKGFTPLVQVWSKRSNEYSFIFAKPGKRSDRFELIILNADGNDTTLVRVDVDAKVLARELGDPRHAGVRISDRGRN